MSTDLAKPTTDPMKAFYEKLADRLRKDVADLLPEDALKQLAVRAVEDAFFKKRQVRKYPNDNYRREIVDGPSQFQEMIVKAAQPTIDRLVAEHLATKKDEIESAVKDAIGQNAIAIAVGAQLAQSIDNTAMRVINYLDNRR